MGEVFWGGRAPWLSVKGHIRRSPAGLRVRKKADRGAASLGEDLEDHPL